MKAKPVSQRRTRDYKSPPPLRFQTVKDAKKHIRANKMKIKEQHTHTRGIRIQVLLPDGKMRTISVNVKKDASQN